MIQGLHGWVDDLLGGMVNGMGGATVLAAVPGFPQYPYLLGVSVRRSKSFVWDLGEQCERELIQTVQHKRRIE